MSLSRVSGFVRRANANKGRVVRALGRAGKHGFWAMADQGVASIGSFGVLFLLGREFAARGILGQFGNFGMLFELMWFLNSVQGALIIYPMSVKGAMSDRPTLSRIAGSCVVLTMVAMPVIAAAAMLMAVIISTSSVGMWAALAAIMWQVQETTRRALMAGLRFRDAIWGDVIRYIGHVVAVGVLARTGYFSLEGVFAMMAAMSALAAAVQAIQLKLNIPGVRETWRFARDAWNLGRWVLAGNASSLCTTTLFTINFRYWWGAEVIGIAFALNNLLRFTNPLLFSISSLITPHAARARATAGLGASKRVLLKFMTLGAVMLLPYLGVLIFFPGLCIRIALKEPGYQQYWLVLVLSALTQGLIYLGQVLAVYLNAVERNRRAFLGQIIYSGLFVVVGMPATALWGLMGAAVGGLVAASILVIVNTVAVQTLPAAEEPPDQPPPSDEQRGYDVMAQPSPAV